MKYISLPPDSLGEFARGASDAVGRRVLRTVQLSKHLLLLKRLVDRAGGDLEQRAVDLLRRVDKVDQRALHTVLAYPHTGAWLTQCQRERSWLDTAHLGAVAASAAIQAGLDFEVAVPARDGTVHLPMLGAAYVGAGDRMVIARAQDGRCWIDGGTVTVELPPDPREDGPHWQGLRTFAESSIILDDLDPYRPPARHRFTGRLSAAEADRWRRSFGAACEILGRGETEWAAEVSDLLASVVPLQRTASGQGVSATSRNAIGSFSAALPSTDEAFAVTIIHEGQHNKLVALHLLNPFVHARSAVRCYSPWRTDPRPAYGLLHGCYAFIGVTDFWLTRCADNKLAAFQYLRSARQVRDALGQLALSPSLTEPGTEFVRAMRQKAETWDVAGFPEDVESAVDDALDDHWIMWCLTNRTVGERGVTRLAKSWLSGDEPGRLPGSKLAAVSSDVFAISNRLRLATARLTDPVRFEASRHNENTGELALADRDYAAARRYFEQHTNNGLIQWSGLAIASLRLNGLRVWYDRPELVREVHRRLGEIHAEPPAPSFIAEWLASGR